MRDDKWIIECRNYLGQLDFAEPQPESVFGMKAITGITEDEMAKAIFRKLPDAGMDGRSINLWPSLIDQRWMARRKTW